MIVNHIDLPFKLTKLSLGNSSTIAFFQLGFKLVLIVFIAAISPNTLLAQDENIDSLNRVANSKADLLDSLVLSTDSLVNLKKKRNRPKKSFLKRIWQDKYPSPRNAVLLSTLLPGTGQIYNKKYWKVPIVYASIGALGYFVYTNGKKYRRFRDAYKKRVDGDLETIDEFEGRLDAAGIRNWRDLHYKNHQLSWIGLVFVWLLNSVDAYVDAHLQNFDVSDDLSMRIQPTFNQGLYANQVGIGLYFYPRQKSVIIPVNSFSIP